MDTPKDLFQRLLKRRDLKLTHERRVILHEVLQNRKHFHADGFYETLRSKGHRISRDTVYRTLPILLESGVIQKSVGEEKRDYYEAAVDGHHDHMVCTLCRKVIEFYSPELEAIQEKICESHDFELNFHEHKLFGLCRECRTPQS